MHAAPGRRAISNRPSWMKEEAYSARVSELQPTSVKKRPRVEDDADVRVAPVRPPEVSRCVFIFGFVSAKKRKGNPYTAGGVAAARREAREHVLQTLGARYGFVRLVRVCQATGDVVVCFAEHESAERCVQALHGTPREEDGAQICADFLVDDDDDVLQSLADDDDDDVQAASRALAAAAARPVRPRCVAIANAFDATAGEEFVARVADEISVECSRFGPVRRAICDPATGEVMVAFASSLSAVECAAAMRELAFDGRLLSTRLFKEQDFFTAGLPQEHDHHREEALDEKSFFWAAAESAQQQHSRDADEGSPPPTPPRQLLDDDDDDDLLPSQESPVQQLKSVRDRPPTPVPRRLDDDDEALISPAASPVGGLVCYASSSEDDGSCH